MIGYNSDTWMIMEKESKSKTVKTTTITKNFRIRDRDVWYLMIVGVSKQWYYYRSSTSERNAHDQMEKNKENS